MARAAPNSPLDIAIEMSSLPFADNDNFEKEIRKLGRRSRHILDTVEVDNVTDITLDPQILFLKGVRCFFGHGVVQSVEDAFLYFQAAAKQQHSGAQNFLGFYYAAGLCVALDPEEAFRNFTLSSEQKNPDGQANVGLCYIRGVGVTVDPKKAFQNFKLSAEQKNAVGQTNVGFCYERGVGVAPDPKKAFQSYRLAAKQGHAAAQNNLGYCYEFGLGVAPDPQKAFKNYELSANQLHARGLNSLGTSFLRGTGVAPDPKEAFRYFKLAAEQGDITGQTNLGRCYENGRGVDPDPKEAARWYSLAAKQKHAPAKVALRKLKIELYRKNSVEYSDVNPDQEPNTRPTPPVANDDQPPPSLKNKENIQARFSASAEVIGAALKAARKEAGLTQMEVAEAMNAKDTSVRRIESGKQNPTLESIERYAEAIGYEIDFGLAPKK